MTVIGLTGASGMTGQHMMALFAKSDINVINVNRSLWDLSRWKTIEELDLIFANVDSVFHFGAIVPSASVAGATSIDNLATKNIIDMNVRACLALAEWANFRNVPVVFLSGAAIYSNPHALNILESSPTTTNALGGLYGFSKYMAEQTFNYFIDKGLKAVILRPSSIYGTGMPADRLVAKFLNLAKRGKVIHVEEPINNSVNFVHASDVASAALSAFKKQAWGTFNIAAKDNVTIYELAEQCIKQAGGGMVKVVKAEKIPQPFVRFDLNFLKANHQFEYEPKIDITEGISAMLADEYAV